MGFFKVRYLFKNCTTVLRYFSRNDSAGLTDQSNLTFKVRYELLLVLLSSELRRCCLRFLGKSRSFRMLTLSKIIFNGKTGFVTANKFGTIITIHSCCYKKYCNSNRCSVNETKHTAAVTKKKSLFHF